MHSGPLLAERVFVFDKYSTVFVNVTLSSLPCVSLVQYVADI